MFFTLWRITDDEFVFLLYICALDKRFHFQAITTLVKNFPKLMSQYINDILPPIWLIFTQSADLYP